MTTNAGPEGNVYWPELRRNLTSDAALNNFTVICPVCATSMRAVASNNRNQAKILHCGHMLCMECTIRICANIDGSRDNPHGRKPKCPMCKERLGKYPHCGESCQAPGRIGFPMPKNMEEMRYLPRTMPEGGSDPSCCKICRIKRIERTSQRLVGLILNDTKSRAKWNPTVDQAKQEAGDFSDYIQVPELQRLLDVLAETVRDPKIYQKYANLYPQQFASDQRAVAEMKDRKRDAL
ncbi:uncharacterized protein CTRU02_213310 [Colletotrichum truncatum]|uniref:Uncharacterized protein n=1 Tax=Colletotrichum truncatum TaxID=5467 RepID=A0ACC3YMF8_COLTU|nr:uncharacterized protein CTRU02_12689 [Colletotrichum truncatum]KAF6784427.1 hypothetical protein CTRU02_12689 [Colletotrichum truncatum]